MRDEARQPHVIERARASSSVRLHKASPERAFN